MFLHWSFSATLGTVWDFLSGSFSCQQASQPCALPSGLPAHSVQTLVLWPGPQSCCFPTSGGQGGAEGQEWPHRIYKGHLWIQKLTRTPWGTEVLFCIEGKAPRSSRTQISAPETNRGKFYHLLPYVLCICLCTYIISQCIEDKQSIQKHMYTINSWK